MDAVCLSSAFPVRVTFHLFFLPFSPLFLFLPLHPLFFLSSTFSCFILNYQTKKMLLPTLGIKRHGEGELAPGVGKVRKKNEMHE